MMKKSKLITVGMAAIALTFGLVLAGCGGGGGDIAKLYEELTAANAKLKSLDRDDTSGVEKANAQIAKINESLQTAWAAASAQGASYKGTSEIINKPEQFEYELTEDGAGVRIEGILPETENIPLIINVPAEIEGYPVVEIGNEAFSFTGNRIISATIPNSVKILGDSAFAQGCGANLTKITLPSNLTKIGQYCFRDSGLTSIALPASVTTIGAMAFAGCKSLTEVVIPEGVTSISEQTFKGCDKLTTVTIPESVTTIINAAFHSCPELTTVNLPSHPIKYTDYRGRTVYDGADNPLNFAFGDCPKLSLAVRKAIQDTGYTGDF